METKSVNNSFNINIKNAKPRWYLKLLRDICIPFTFLNRKLIIHKTNFKNIKGGCLVLSNHMSFNDFVILQRVIFPRMSYNVSSVDEYIFKEKLMLGFGCIPKRVHHTDLLLVRHLIRLLKDGNIVSLYPEATYSFAGINSSIDTGLGRLAKIAKVPVIVINEKGNYIYSPRWNKLPKNKIKRVATATMIVSKEEVLTLSDTQIQERIEKAFVYDDYKYQRDNNIEINSKTKANNIERILYKCPICNKEGFIKGNGNDILMNCCSHKATIDKFSILHFDSGFDKFISISDWFKYQQEKVNEEVDKGIYYQEFDAKVSRLVNSKVGFDIDFAKVHVVHNKDGIYLKGKETKTNNDFEYLYSSKKEHTLHVTFEVKGNTKQAFEVHTDNDSYLIYPNSNVSVLKIRFAHERLNANSKKEDNNEKE